MNYVTSTRLQRQNTFNPYQAMATIRSSLTYSDKIGRSNAYFFNGIVSALCLFLAPTIMQSGSVLLLFVVVGVMYWQYGGGLALMPAFTADYFGSKNLGLR